MRLAIILLLAFAGLRGGDLVSYKRDGNRFALKVSDGWAELEWISHSAFRFSRGWRDAAPRTSPIGHNVVSVSVTDTGPALRFKTEYVTLDLARSGLLLAARDSKGAPLVSDAEEIHRTGQGFVLEKTSPAAERFRGLGPRDAPAEGSRGIAVAAATPFLMSSLGYGEYYRGNAGYQFDLAQSRPDRRRTEIRGGGRIEYFFYFGPSPKEILEEHVQVSDGLREIWWRNYEPLSSSALPREATVLPGTAASWDGLRELLRRLHEASYSAMLLPAVDLSPYLAGDKLLASRAAGLAGVMPLVFGSKPGLPGAVAARRKQWIPYQVAYAYESQDRGFPTIRPLGMQFPKDPEAVRRTDEFMFGDELLAAPILDAGDRRTVYLPAGIWTNLRTNQFHKGRETVEVRAAADELPLFAKNGSIVPVATGADAMTLHYFPRLGAEFFLYEDGTGDLTQAHAAPAAEFMRLEIEPALERTYDWIVHHSEPCSKVMAGTAEYARAESLARLKPGSWFYDAQARNLHVRARVPAGADHILNVSFQVK